ncbi:MAG: 1-phosphofructokinase [Clostridia bacterium]|nr:1-phosphofructokinase [Clostridia bacterium]
MITTICLNPCFDKTVTVDAMTVGGLHRVRTMRTDPGGKGANVANVLSRLGAPVRCLGLAGEQGAKAYEDLLEKAGVPQGFLHVCGEVRTNLKIVSLDGSEVTEINEPGPMIPEKRLNDLLKVVRENCGGDDFLVLTGSLPPGCADDTYARLVRALNVPAVVDASGKSLRASLAARPFLVKPNKAELCEAVGRKLEDLGAVERAARELMAAGARHVLVSLGAEGALLVTPDKVWHADGLKVKVSSTVGAGDAMTAGFVAGFVETGDFVEAFRRGVAAGTASVMTDGTQLIRLEDYEALLGRVTIREV